MRCNIRYRIRGGNEEAFHCYLYQHQWKVFCFNKWSIMFIWGREWKNFESFEAIAIFLRVRKKSYEETKKEKWKISGKRFKISKKVSKKYVSEKSQSGKSKKRIKDWGHFWAFNSWRPTRKTHLSNICEGKLSFEKQNVTIP